MSNYYNKLIPSDNRKCEPHPSLMFLKKTQSQQSHRPGQGFVVLGVQDYPKRRHHLNKALPVEISNGGQCFKVWTEDNWAFLAISTKSQTSRFFFSSQLRTAKPAHISQREPKTCKSCRRRQKGAFLLTRCLIAFIFYHVYI